MSMEAQGTAPQVDGRTALLESLLCKGHGGFAHLYIIRAVVDLGIPDILAKAGGHLTVGEIAAKLPTTTAHMAFLARIMTFAATCNIFEGLTDSSGGVVEDAHKRFGQTAASEALLEKEAPDPQLSLAHWVRFITDSKILDPFKYLAAAVLSGEMPTRLAFGMGEWEATMTDPKWGQTVNNAFAAKSAFCMSELLKSYKGFEDVKRLVDVGGNIGACLAAITRAYPHIHGVNFDLPHVILHAPGFPGVENVGGDMFKEVPESDAIFMKEVLHDWSDQKCITILENCYKSLPQGGKVIILETVLPEPKQAAFGDYVMDILMLAAASGRERTGKEWLHILNAANFQGVEIGDPPRSLGFSVIKAHKSKST